MLTTRNEYNVIGRSTTRQRHLPARLAAHDAQRFHVQRAAVSIAAFQKPSSFVDDGRVVLIIIISRTRRAVDLDPQTALVRPPRVRRAEGAGRPRYDPRASQRDLGRRGVVAPF